MVWTKKQEDELRNSIMIKNYDQLAAMFKTTNREVWHKVRSMRLLMLMPIRKFKRRQSELEDLQVEMERQDKPRYSIDAITYFAVVRHGLLNGKKSGAGRCGIKRETFGAILQDIADVFELEATDIRKGPRGGELPFCRQLFCLIARRLYPLRSLGEIGKFVGYTNPSMCLRNIKVITKGLQENDPTTITQYSRYMRESKLFKN